jgi:hypothetical protein
MWWARQDSNLQPDRYERPALTIELQAPPRLPPREGGEATVRPPFTGGAPFRQCRAFRFRVNPLTRPRIPPPCATSGSRWQ